MSKYLVWETTTLSDFSDEAIEKQYDAGFVFTRLGKGTMDQTRSVRVNLNSFEMSSENRRILRKTEEVTMEIQELPLSDYHWSIGKMAKDFYDTKFGEGTFSANKVKQLLTDTTTSNFNKLFVFKKTMSNEQLSNGYCIALETNDMIHYSYPFYSLDDNTNQNQGMGMMVRAIQYAKEQGKQYLYLGSAQRPGDIYKLQFKGLEWFDGKKWNSDQEPLKQILKSL